MRAQSLLALVAILLAGVGCGSSASRPAPQNAPRTPTQTTTPCGGAGILCHVAGQAGLSGPDGDGGAATAARLNRPGDVVLDPAGRLVVLDTRNARLRRVASGTIVFLAGSLGDTCSGSGAAAGLDGPTGGAYDATGFLHVADWGSHKLKRFDDPGFSLFCVAGTTQGLSGDGGPAYLAQFSHPSGVAFDPMGNLYVTDQDNHRIRRVDTGQSISTLAGSTSGYANGTGAAAMFDFGLASQGLPGGRLAFHSGTNSLVVADTANHRIRRISLPAGVVTTLAGTGVPGFSGDGGAALAATFGSPTDVAVGPDGSVYVADTGNHAVRRIRPDLTITTVAGIGAPGSSADRTLATAARLNQPYGVEVAADGTLYIADTGNHQVKRVLVP